MSKVRRYSHSVEITVNLGAVIMIALVIWLCVALAGCGTAATAAAPAHPAQCTALLAQIRAFDNQVTASQKSNDVMSEVGASSAFQMTLRSDAASPAVPQRLWTAETGMAGALQTMNAPALNASLYQIKAVCG